MTSNFIVYPAIDLRGGQVVRLKQGRTDAQTTFSDDPGLVARRWEEQGAQWLHVVNLDRALGERDSANANALRGILDAVRIPIQFGGGLRTCEDVSRALEWGVSRVVFGTIAIEAPQIVGEAIGRFGAEKIAIAIDARNGRVATRGWSQTSEVNAVELGMRMREDGVRRVIVTDIARDGMLTGIDADSMAGFAKETGLSVIASGGVASAADLRGLKARSGSGVEGAIVGQALYTDALHLDEIIRELEGDR